MDAVLTFFIDTTGGFIDTIQSCYLTIGGVNVSLLGIITGGLVVTTLIALFFNTKKEG